MTCKELFIALSKLTMEELEDDAAVRMEFGETYPVYSLILQAKDDVLHKDHPVMVARKEVK